MRNQFAIGNQYGKMNKGKTYTSKGTSHDSQCAHCVAVRREGIPMTRVDTPPLCNCHHAPMYWNKMSRLKNGGTWKCKVMVKESGRKGRLKKFGITEAEYSRLFNQQGGTCAICKGLPDTRWKMLAVDHDHSTGKVRGLLCMTCNTMLGRLEDRLDKVLEYIGATT